MSDADLAKRAQKGDREAFMELAHRYQHQVYRLTYRYSGNTEDANDLSQDCFVRAFQQIRRFDSDRPFLPWLMRLAANVCLNSVKSRKRLRSREASLEDESLAYAIGISSEGDAELEAMEHVEHQQVRAELANLPDDIRLLVSMRFVLGLSFREISEATGVKLATVAFRVSKGLDLLRKRLAPETEVSDR